VPLGDKLADVPGLCGIVPGSILPGFYGLEAGQSAVGDIFNWFVNYIQPLGNKVGTHEALSKAAARVAPGESGLLALDWWNGNRSILVDVDLTGMMLGMTLATRAEEIYRALIEATAYGTRQIIEAFNSKGVAVKELMACGGLPERNPLLMQIYADVTGLEIKLADPLMTCSALGSAMHGAVAAGREAGGYDSILDAARKMAHTQRKTYKPNLARHEVYNQLFKEYQGLHDYFGRGANDVMKRLKTLKRQVATA